jgi:hemerythrin
MLTWEDSLALGNPAIDDDHRQAVMMMNRIAMADDAATAQLFSDFVAHMRTHFAREEALMHETGFPAMHCHKDEHARVLGLLDAIARDSAAGDGASARSFCAEAGPSWFIEHRQTMDYVTVAWARGRSAR